MSIKRKREPRMARREILVYGNRILRQKCNIVEKIDDRIRELIHDMKETMSEASGAGLAAPQVGSLDRVIITKISENDDNNDVLVLINPKLLEYSGKIDSEEGCLSIPGITETVSRYKTVVVEYLSENGSSKVVHTNDFLGRVLQHEMDHLEGILFIDRLGLVRRDMLKRKLRKRFGKKERLKT